MTYLQGYGPYTRHTGQLSPLIEAGWLWEIEEQALVLIAALDRATVGQSAE